jgi:hypothetical protein
VGKEGHYLSLTRPPNIWGRGGDLPAPLLLIISGIIVDI